MLLPGRGPAARRARGGIPGLKAQRLFLWAVAIVAILVIAGAILWRLAADRLIAWAFTPRVSFAESAVAPPPDYRDASAWVARPDLPENPARFVPPGFRAAPRPIAAAFFVPPTAFFGRDRWTAPLDDAETNERLALFTRNQASAFNGIAAVWAPRYRQAALGAFFRPGPEADQALDLAYSDVVRAFAAFLAAQAPDAPLLLAGHSQGSRHLLRLYAERVAGTPLADRVVAVWAVGWPVTPADLARLRLAPCRAREEAGCLLSWQSWAGDADLARAAAGLARARRFTGAPVGSAPMVCTNPLTGGEAPAAGREANLGALLEGRLEPRLAGARCTAPGILALEPSPGDIGPLVLPDGNYHAYDYNLFWANVRADAEARLSAHAARAASAGRPPAPEDMRDEAEAPAATTGAAPAR